MSDTSSNAKVGKKDCPAIFISGPSSNQGKTTVSAGLACLYRLRGKKVRVFKAGPDFLDPMILERASGNPVYQLDLWMTGASECRKLLYNAAEEADLIIVEGVMGLFDGKPSSADIAELFGLPVVAVINAGSMAQTFGAIAFGLKNFRADLPFAGVLANGVASARHAEMIPEAIPADIKFLGALFKRSELEFPHRHLGLLQAAEIENLDTIIEAAAEALKWTELAQLPKPVRFSAPKPVRREPLLSGVKIAIARDLAFSFIYRANLDFLEEMGATLTYFSPLTDKEIPACDCLYFPGGYPEMFINELEANVEIGDQIREHFQANKPIYAECGGMLYALDSLTDKDGLEGKMLGLLSGKGIMQNRLKSLSYQSIDLGDGELRGHTFHYSECEMKVQPLAHGKRLHDGGQGEPMYKEKSLVASYLHLYFSSNPTLAAGLFQGLKVRSKVT
jgi:cobyrinic acid a,c-diamide synthase